MLRFVVVVLAGCSTFTVGRTSFGLTGTTSGELGLSAAVELGVGYIDTPHQISEDVTRRGEAVAIYGGGGVTTAGAQIEAGAHTEYVSLTGRRALRIGLRNGVVARQNDRALMVFDATIALGWAGTWDPHRSHRLGLELRAGPALSIEERTSPDELFPFRWDSMRFYAGIVHDRMSISRHRYDPLRGLGPTKH